MISVVPSSGTKKSLETATAEYASQLSGSPGELALLERGITKETQAAFRLGFVESPLLGDEEYKGHITIPYLTVSGVVSMRYRRQENGTTFYDKNDFPKYLSTHGDKGRPYNVGSLGDEIGPYFITEGEMDAIIASQAGAMAVGFPGATTWRSVFGRLFRFRTVYVLADGDDAGRHFADTVRKSIEGAKVIEMHPGGDVNSMYLEHGEQYLREWVGLDE